jgi:hypothetical protein
MGLVNGEWCMVNGEQSSVKAISQAALGRALGLSPSAVTKLKGQGMPVDSVRSAQAWREARQNVAQRKPTPTNRPTSPDQGRIEVGGQPVFGGASFDTPEPGDFPDEDRDKARTRREIAEANMAEMEEAKQRRELIRVSAVQAQLATDYATTRDAMLQIAPRLGPLLAAESDPAAVQNMLHAEIHQALMKLAGAADHVPMIDGAFD